MSLVRLIGFSTLWCGCVVGRYRELSTSNEKMYVEEKGQVCDNELHRRNHRIVQQPSVIPVRVVGQEES